MKNYNKRYEDKNEFIQTPIQDGGTVQQQQEETNPNNSKKRGRGTPSKLSVFLLQSIVTLTA